MTEWMLRRQGGRAVGPVPTRALVRGIKLGKVPPDTEAREVGGEAWLPLASYDDFYEALGLDDAETRVVETPWFMGDAARRSPGDDELSDADEEDEEATRVMDALSESVPPRSGVPDLESGQGSAPLPAAGQAPRPPPVRIAAPPRTEPRPDAIAAVDGGELAAADPEDDAVTSVIDAPSEQAPMPGGGLLDDDDEPSSAVRSLPLAAPLPAAGRPARPTFPPAAPVCAPAGQPPNRSGTSQLSQARAKVQSHRRFVPEPTDEHTAPAMRFARQIDSQRTVLTLLIAVTVVLAVVVIVLLLRR
jgi:hypothetical protein